MLLVNWHCAVSMLCVTDSAMNQIVSSGGIGGGSRYGSTPRNDCRGGRMKERGEKGIYSTTGKAWIGSGMTKRKVVAKRYWFAFALPDGKFRVQPLTGTMIPAGTPRDVSAREFQETFVPETDFYVDEVRIISLMPQAQRPDSAWAKKSSSVRSGTRGGAKAGNGTGEVQDAPPPVQVSPESAPCTPGDEAGVSDVLERAARADFEEGMGLLEQGDTRRALEVFASLVERKAIWQPHHKHMFCEFGTGLRKNRLLDVALRHYLRALELAPADENLHHNIARVYYEQGKFDECRQWLEQSLEINPELVPSQQFLAFLLRSGKATSARDSSEVESARPTSPATPDVAGSSG